MAIYANQVIQDALALIDVVTPGEASDPWWSELGTRLLNGLLGEWSAKGFYNPNQTSVETILTEALPYVTFGVDNSIRTLSNTKYSIVETEDLNGLYYKSINGTVTKYSTVGTGTKYSLVVTEDTAGTFYQINGGYSEKLVGNIPVNFSTVDAVQLDLGPVVYSPRKITLAEYMSISVKQTQSPPSVFAWDYQTPVSKLYFFPRALPGMTVRVVGQPTIESISNSQSIVPIDDIYYTAILYNLATKLYPFLKRDSGIDQEMIYLAKTSVSALRSRTLVMKSRHVNCPFKGEETRANDIWNSPLNTISFIGN